MKYIFMCITIACAIIMGIQIALANKRKGRYALPVICLCLAAIFSIIFYDLTILSEKPRAASLMLGFFYASIDWMLVSVFDYTQAIGRSRGKKRNTVLMIVYITLSFVDTLSMGVNMMHNHTFTIASYFGVDGALINWISYPNVYFYVHLAFCYVITLNIIVEIVIKIVTLPKIYRRPYYVVLIAFTAIIAYNLLGMIFKWRYNYSILMYSFVAINSYFFSFHLIPRSEEKLLQDIMSENMASAVACFDPEGKCIRANRAARKLFGINGTDMSVVEQYLSVWLYVFPSVNNDTISGEDIIEIDGVEHIFTQEYHRFHDKKGRLEGSYLKLDDRTDEIEKLNAQRYLATHDRLTGLYNRAHFFELCARVLQDYPDDEFVMVATNIKNFTLINDSFGTDFGDDILVRQAKMLMLCDYDDCIQGRISADKFAMLIRKADFDPEAAVRNTLEVQKVGSEVKYHICMHLGVYEIANHNENVQNIYDRAALAIRKIKDSFEQTIAYYDTTLMEELLHKKNVLSDFDAALEGGQFTMFLQPQVDREGRAIGAEALARWIHPIKGLVPPFRFIPILEETGYIYRLDRYIWELAAKKLSEWKKAGLTDYYISVNISTRDFYFTDLFTTFYSLVKQYDIDPKNLKLEITETTLMHDMESHKKVLKDLTDAGFHIEMDDFGSGYSSLQLLKRIHMDVLKIDMEFLRQTANPGRAQSIIESIIVMAKELGMTVITEGVEDVSQVEFLKAADCDVFQGYYFSKPIPVSEFEEKYIRRASA